MPRVFYASFMLLALAVFLLNWPADPQAAGTARAAVVELRGAGCRGLHRRRLGGKVPFAAAHQEGWFSYAAWFSDGKTIVAGLIGAYLAVELSKLLLGIHVKTGDTFALPLALAMAVGRWGCFFNGCCYGVETTLPWGVWFRVPEEGGSSLAEMSSNADLRKPLSLHDGRCAMATHAARSAAGTTTQTVPHRLWRLSLPHRVHPSRAGLVAGPDLLPVGRCGSVLGMVLQWLADRRMKEPLAAYPAVFVAAIASGSLQSTRQWIIITCVDGS